MTKFKIYLMMIIFFGCFFNHGFGFISQEIDKSITAYPTNKSAAVSNLIDLYDENSGYFSFIKSYLFDNQHYRLYRDFLRKIPQSQKTVSDLFLLDILTEQTNNMLDDLDNYMDYHTTLDSLLISYSEEITSENISSFLSDYLTNKIVFDLLSEAYLMEGKTKQFDQILLNYGLDQALSNSIVSNYIINSWYKTQRNLTPLIRGYELTNSLVMKGILLYSEYQDENYDEVISRYEAQPDLFDADRLSKFQIDIHYILANSYYEVGDYTNSQYYLDQVVFPWSYDLAQMTFLNYLAMNDLESAEYQLSFIKNEENQNFYNILLTFLNGDTNQGVEGIQDYLLDVETDHNYLQEAILLYHAHYLVSELFTDTLNMIVDSILNKKPLPISNYDLTYAYLTPENETNSGSERVNDYLQYKNALQLMKQGEETAAQKILTELITADDTSPLIKSLSVYKLRDLS